jgi:hypothetical protein
MSGTEIIRPISGLITKLSSVVVVSCDDDGKSVGRDQFGGHFLEVNSQVETVVDHRFVHYMQRRRFVKAQSMQCAMHYYGCLACTT